MSTLIMVTRVDPGEEPEAEPIIVTTDEDGDRMMLRLDDGVVLIVDTADLIAIAMGEDLPARVAA